MRRISALLVAVSLVGVGACSGDSSSPETPAQGAGGAAGQAATGQAGAGLGGGGKASAGQAGKGQSGSATTGGAAGKAGAGQAGTGQAGTAGGTAGQSGQGQSGTTAGGASGAGQGGKTAGGGAAGTGQGGKPSGGNGCATGPDPAPPGFVLPPEQSPGDTTTTFSTTPNWPLKKPLPTVASATPGDNLALASGSKNAFSLVMGCAQPGANLTTSQQIRDTFFMNYITGDQNKAFGSPVDTGQPSNATFAAVARHYLPGDPNDVHVMYDDGMHLRAICSNNRADCSPGKVWGAMVRLPFEWRPGMTVKVRYRSPPGDHQWGSIWMFTGSQISPGPGGDPYKGFNTDATLLRSSSVGFEIDWNDNYSRFGQGVPTGFQIDYGTPDIYGTKWQTPPHAVYWANTGGYVFHANAGPDFEETPFNWSAGFHDLVGNWRGDGSHLIDLFVDGRLVVTSYMEYPQTTYVDPADGQTKTVAMNLMISNEAIPSFSPGASSAQDNDGVAEGWTIVIQEISGWYGNIANPDSYK